MHSPHPSSDFSLPKQQLQQLRAGIDQLEQQPQTAAVLSQQARSAQALLQQLPARYSEVLLHLLDRLESGALFSEESCSFSQQALRDQLLQWTDKAQAQLSATSPE